MSDKQLGRPKINPAEKKMPNGLTINQWNRVKEEACKRDMPAAQYLRQIVNWHFTALDENRIITQSDIDNQVESKSKVKRVKDRQTKSNVRIKFQQPQNIVKEN